MMMIIEKNIHKYKIYMNIIKDQSKKYDTNINTDVILNRLFILFLELVI